MEFTEDRDQELKSFSKRQGEMIKESVTAERAIQIIAALSSLLQDAKAGHVPRSTQGICFNLLDAYGIRESFELVPWLAYKWPDRKANSIIWPIQERHSFSRWKGPNLEQRISLLRYMIKRMRDYHRRLKEPTK